MRISRFALAAVVVALMPALAGAAATNFRSARAALDQGVSAFRGGYYEIAIPALEFAAGAKEMMASFYLARIYSDNNGSHTDHAKAYAIYERIVDENLDIDPDSDPRAPYVGKALTALAGYVRTGLPEIGLKPDLGRAVYFLNNASTSFNDEDAQFELAKLQLTGEGVEANVPLGRHWLARLSRSGHAGAQAFFADLLWRGKHVEADPARALALISIAVAHAPAHERLWIEDIYQNIFCGAGDGTRKQATGLVATWGKTFDRRAPTRLDSNPGDELSPSPMRTCRNGELVNPIEASARPAPIPAGAVTPAPLDISVPPTQVR